MPENSQAGRVVGLCQHKSRSGSLASSDRQKTLESFLREMFQPGLRDFVEDKCAGLACENGDCSAIESFHYEAAPGWHGFLRR